MDTKRAPFINIEHLGFALWSLLNLVAASFVGFVSYVFISLQYYEMHTSSTARDPIYDLERETVVFNVLGETLKWLLPLLPAAGVFWGFTFWMLRNSVYRKASFRVAIVCTLLTFGGLIWADWECLRRFPEVAIW